MTTTINASTVSGLVTTADTSGVLALQTANTTAVTIDASQNTTLAGTLTTTGITNSGVATATRFNPTGSSVTGNGMYLPAANSLGLSTNGTNAVYINSSQNVGIGTASPANKLHVSDTTTSTVKTRTEASTGYVDVGMGGNSGVFDTTATDGIRLRTSGNDQVSIDTAGVFKFNSGYGSVATAYGCRAWVNFNGTGTVAIRASANVSSITDNATGLYTVNYTNALPDVNYSVSMNMQPSGDPGGGICHIGPTGLSPANYSTTATTIRTAWSSAGQDPPIVVFAAFR